MYCVCVHSQASNRAFSSTAAVGRESDSSEEEDKPVSLVEQHRAKMAEKKIKGKEEVEKEELEEERVKQERLKKVYLSILLLNANSLTSEHTSILSLCILCTA